MKTLDKIIGKIERFIENLYMQGIYEEHNKRNIQLSEENHNLLIYQKN